MSEKYINLEIDGRKVSVKPGTRIIDAAASLGIEIPTLCYLKELTPEGACRMCLVEVKGAKKPLVTACSEPCTEGMQVVTNSESVFEARRFVLDSILSTHNKDCFSCAANSRCKLQQYCYEYGIEKSTYEDFVKPEWNEKDTTSPFFEFDPSKCIACHRCVRTCQELRGVGVIGLKDRGFDVSVGTPFNLPWNETDCESCGNCVSNCPTGALSSKDNIKNFRWWEVEKVLTTCPHCATGCQYYLLVNRKKNKIVGVEPADGPSNHNMLCVKGQFGSFKFVGAEDRLKYPLIKENGEFRRASWTEALDLIESKFKAIKKDHGADAIAGFSCSRAPNEDNYLFQKMMRAAFGTNNVDNCARVCHSASVHGLAITLGSGAMTNTIADITDTPDAILLVGSNTTEAHPVAGAQIRRAVKNGSKLIVVDPRKIDLTKDATLHLQIRPGTDIAFSYGMINIFIRDGLIDEKFIAERTEGFEKVKEIAAQYPPEKAAEICCIDAADLEKAAHIYAEAERAPIIYCLGITEHSTGTENVMSMSNIAMAVGKIGKPGCGVNPFRGQNNVQGACDMGCVPYQYPGYQSVKNDDVRKKFENLWGVELSREEGLTATQVIPAAGEGRIRGLYIFGEDQAYTDPNVEHVKECLNNLDFLVVQELFMSETAKLADVVLPGVSYAEKEGTFSNTERRVQRVRKAVEPAGEARPDTDIFVDVMNRMGYPQKPVTSAELMDELAKVTPSFAGISHERLDSAEVGGKGLQWPCLNKEHPGTPIMHVGKFSRGLGLFYPCIFREAMEMPDAQYPVTLMTGRNLYHYNNAAMTARTPEINEVTGTSYIELSRQLADSIGIGDGDKVQVESRRGKIVTTARVGDKVRDMDAWMPFHYPDGNPNVVANDATDDIAHIPEYKVCAIRVSKA